uniref:Spermatogenesis associated 1 n=1 Tax=Myripristis murdjan TaxID=586833 RepID=A0A667ZK62_9TELE
KLNKVPAEATDSFISAGFIRVYPDITLKTLRGELGILLGTERSLDKFSFLKCVGRSLALVSTAGCLVLQFSSWLCFTRQTVRNNADSLIVRAVKRRLECCLVCCFFKVTEPPVVSSLPVQYTSSPPASDLALATHKTAASPAFQTNSRLPSLNEIKLVREERKQLEWTRQELLRKGKDLLAQNRHRRNQGGWKKKYFETKKATAPLEDTLRNLRQELETFYNKLLHQLQARDSRGKPRRQGRSSTKNELIIQIMTESHEIDNLKRKVEDAKMKLVTEIKVFFF